MNSNHDPVDALVKNSMISEILINDYDKIYFEHEGRLTQHSDRFPSPQSYLFYIERLCEKLHRPLNREQPFLEIQLEDIRYTLVFSEISSGAPLLSIRKRTIRDLSFEKIVAANWCDQLSAECIYDFIKYKKNILIAGPTSSGKTTVLQALLHLTGASERCVIIEDTKELQVPNAASASLLVREHGSGTISPVSMEDLIKRALRLRPDRLIVGEVRGSEAYSLLLALSTGHKGSMSSIHAADARQALLRLEMLVQLGAPEWDLRSIRRLITLSLDAIIIVEKANEGRRLKEICKINSLEESGIILEKLF